MSGARLYFRLLGNSIRSQLQYRASFILATIGAFLVTGVEIVGIWALFERFERLGDWTLPEVAFFYGTISIAFAIGDALGTGFDRMAGMVRGGDFDRVLLRPRAAALQVLGMELALRRSGRLAQGLLVLAWATLALDNPMGPPEAALLLLAIIGGACLFLGLFVIQGTLTFWTTEALETLNAFSYGGATAGQYPITIYADWFRRFFTFVVPLACVTYFPLSLILGREMLSPETTAVRAASPLAGVLFLAGALVFWSVGVRKYQSTGS